MGQRYKFIFNGKWNIRLSGEKLYDIIDVVENKLIESTDSPFVVKKRLKTLNNYEKY
jgi:hypothetical protein